MNVRCETLVHQKDKDLFFFFFFLNLQKEQETHTLDIPVDDAVLMQDVDGCSDLFAV